MNCSLESRGSTRTYHVLAVDDDPNSTELTRIALENAGPYVVREVNDPKVAVDMATEFAPDLIIMDVDMPRLDGRAAALLMQCKDSLKDVPILFLTSMIPESAGGNPFGWFGPLAKPVTPKRLASAVENILRNGTIGEPSLS
jgi:CheY-like chemotaxis protein